MIKYQIEIKIQAIDQNVSELRVMVTEDAKVVKVVSRSVQNASVRDDTPAREWLIREACRILSNDLVDNGLKS